MKIKLINIHFAFLIIFGLSQTTLSYALNDLEKNDILNFQKTISNYESIILK